MPRSREVPPVQVLDAIQPQEQGNRIVSPNLQGFIDKYDRSEADFWANFLNSPPDSLIEERDARRLANIYFLKTAEKEQTSPNHELWVDRFNHADKELYSDPIPSEALYLIAQELMELESANPESLAAKLYRRLLADTTTEARPSFDFDKLAPLQDALFMKLAPIKEVIDELEDKEFSPAEVRVIFGRIKDNFAQSDPDWNQWKITNTEGKTMLSVRLEKKEIEVPDGRQPVSGKTELFGLAMHELGVHAQRSINGNKTGDEMMAQGLPEYSDFEEGLATIVEFLCTNEVPQKIKDRYVDIALAKGLVGGTKFSREQLINLGISRETARLIAQKQPVDESAVAEKVKNHVNRIFRGGDGLPILGPNGEVLDQAVFGKDAVYYDGFLKAYEFIVGKIDSGYPMDELLDYLLAGKFDATNQKHTTYLAEEHSITL